MGMAGRGGKPLDRILWHTAEAAANLLTSQDRADMSRVVKLPTANGSSLTTAAIAAAAGAT